MKTNSRAADLGLTLLAIVLGAGLLHVWTSGPSASAQSANGLSGMTAATADTALLTCDGGNEDVLLVLDQQGEEILVYAPKSTTALEFKGRHGLRELFAEGRVRAGVPTSTPTPNGPGVINPSR